MEENERLISAAKEARTYAYAPYSGYRVGAAVQDDSGRIYTGCNIENASYGATMCAERTAIFKAVSGGAGRIVKIAVTAEKSMPYPCGMCRQVMTEFMQPDGMIILECGGKQEKFTLGELLPHTFRV